MINFKFITLRHLAVMLLLLIFCAGTAMAQSPAEPLRLSPNEAVELAIRNNLMLESARIGLGIRERRARHAWNQFLPSAAVTGTTLRDNWPTTQGFDIPALGITPITIPQWHLTGAFSTTLDFSFALFEGVRTARLEYEAGFISLERAKLQMEQAIRKMYNNILFLKANVSLLEESLNNTQRQANIAEANFRAGLAPRLTWLQAQVAVQNMKPAVRDLENALKTLKGHFAMMLGLPFDTVFELEQIPSDIPIIPFEVAELISWAATSKPDIQELRASILALESQQRALRLAHFTPFLRFGWTLSSMFNPILDPFRDDLFNADNWNRGGNFSFTLGMSLNGLFPFTREGQQRRDMEANMQIQSIRLAQMIQETELEIFTKINSLERIRATAEASQAAVELAELSHRLTEEAYRAGLQDFQSLQSASLALEQARLQLLREHFNYLNDLIDLEYAIGVPFGTLSNLGR